VAGFLWWVALNDAAGAGQVKVAPAFAGWRGGHGIRVCGIRWRPETADEKNGRDFKRLTVLRWAS
jgi:hypothetical protein